MEAEKDGEYTYFEQRPLSQRESVLMVNNANSSDKPGQGYGGWLYDNSANRLYTIAPANGGGNKYYLYYEVVANVISGRIHRRKHYQAL